MNFGREWLNASFDLELKSQRFFVVPRLSIVYEQLN